MKKVLVTGGAGFIGSHTAVELYRAGYLPVVVDSFARSERSVIERMQQLIGEDFPVYPVDCTDKPALLDVLRKEAPLSGVIHFAAYKAVGESVKNPLLYYDNNLNSLLRLLEAMEATETRNLVFSSSCTVYGEPDVLPVTEQSPQKPAESPYGRTKQICEDILNDRVRSEATLRAVTLRYFNPVGAHPSGLLGELPIGKPENLVPYIVQTATGVLDKLTVFGSDYPTPDGTCIRDYIHVVDLAEAHVAALRWIDAQPGRSFNEVFNVGTGEGASVLQVIAAFEAATGQKLRYELGPRRPGDVIQTYASVDKATAQLGWGTKLSLSEALRDAYHWQLQLNASRS